MSDKAALFIGASIILAAALISAGSRYAPLSGGLAAVDRWTGAFCTRQENC